MSEDIIKTVQQLLVLGRGDQGRLEYVLDLLKRGKVLPDSDVKYLQIMVSLYLNSTDDASTQKHLESMIERQHNEIEELNRRLKKFEGRGFEKYIGRKTILFFVTVFVGWNALETYIQGFLSNFIPDNLLQSLFPLALIADHFYNNSVIWLIFLILLLLWPLIGSIYLVKFIKSRKIPK